jgi:putative PIN family toxin of toxin-antitoxin system
MPLFTKSDKIVLDTNIVISALIGKQGESAKLFKLVISEEIENYTTAEIIKEVGEVLSREEIIKRTLKEERQFILEQYLIHSKLTEPKTKHSIIEHASDNKFIDAAIEAKAKFIISGDKHLLEKKEFKGVKIINAKDYLGNDSNGN